MTDNQPTIPSNQLVEVIDERNEINYGLRYLHWQPTSMTTRYEPQQHKLYLQAEQDIQAMYFNQFHLDTYTIIYRQSQPHHCWIPCQDHHVQGRYMTITYQGTAMFTEATSDSLAMVKERVDLFEEVKNDDDHGYWSHPLVERIISVVDEVKGP